jgi:hypothetical protein
VTGAARAAALLAALAGCSFEKDEFQLGEGPDAQEPIDPPDGEDAADESDGPDVPDLPDAPTTPDAPGGCPVALWLTCGDRIVGTTAAPPARSETSGYPQCVSWDETGPELLYAFSPAVTGMVSVTLSDTPPDEAEPPDDDVDLFVLDGECEAAACMAYGDVTASFSAVAGRTYYLSVDGFMGADSDFLLTLTCP